MFVVISRHIHAILIIVSCFLLNTHVCSHFNDFTSCLSVCISCVTASPVPHYPSLPVVYLVPLSRCEFIHAACVKCSSLLLVFSSPDDFWIRTQFSWTPSGFGYILACSLLDLFARLRCLICFWPTP